MNLWFVLFYFRLLYFSSDRKWKLFNNITNKKITILMTESKRLWMCWCTNYIFFRKHQPKFDPFLPIYRAINATGEITKQLFLIIFQLRLLGVINFCVFIARDYRSTEGLGRKDEADAWWRWESECARWWLSMEWNSFLQVIGFSFQRYKKLIGQ